MKTQAFNRLYAVALDVAVFAILCMPAISWAQSAFDSDTRRADTYRRSDAMAEGEVQACVVLAARLVTLEAGNTARVARTTAGSVLGAVLAGRNTSNYTAPVLGGLLGGYAGHAVVQKMSTDRAHEIILQCAGRAVTVIQEVDDSPAPAKGAQVHLIRVGGRSRVVH